MGKIRGLIAYTFLTLCVRAQDTPSSQEDVNPLHPSMSVVLIVLSMMFCLTFLIVAYAKFCNRPDEYEVNEPQQLPGGIVRSRSRFSGLDRTTIEKLPFFRFSSLKGSREGLECAVCLSRFEDTEILRLLPKCRHAFHKNCIDKWLESHSSCPLCRYRFDIGDLKSFTYTTTSPEDPNLEFFIQREENQERPSLRFNLSKSWQKIAQVGKREESLIQYENNSRKMILHNVKHKIIVSDVMYRSRWSDVNSSDLMSLSSDMLNVLSSKRFSNMESHSGRFSELSGKDQNLKIREDMDRKRFYESKVRGTDICSGESSTCVDDSDSIFYRSRTLDPAEKRSMSEITNVSRFTELNARSRISGSMSSGSGNAENDDNVRRIWLPIARRTIQLFAGRETGSQARNHTSNV